MEVDNFDDVAEIPAFQSQKAVGKRPAVLPVDDAHPFDLENYISSYTGMSYFI